MKIIDQLSLKGVVVLQVVTTTTGIVIEEAVKLFNPKPWIQDLFYIALIALVLSQVFWWVAKGISLLKNTNQKNDAN